MIGEARESIERQAGTVEGSEAEDGGLTVKALGVVRGRSASSRRYDGGSSSSSSSESEDSD
jgi:hypothetical protein